MRAAAVSDRGYRATQLGILPPRRLQLRFGGGAQ